MTSIQDKLHTRSTGVYVVFASRATHVGGRDGIQTRAVSTTTLSDDKSVPATRPGTNRKGHFRGDGRRCPTRDCRLRRMPSDGAEGHVAHRSEKATSLLGIRKTRVRATR